MVKTKEGITDWFFEIVSFPLIWKLASSIMFLGSPAKVVNSAKGYS